MRYPSVNSEKEISWVVIYLKGIRWHQDLRFLWNTGTIIWRAIPSHILSGYISFELPIASQDSHCLLRSGYAIQVQSYEGQYLVPFRAVISLLNCRLLLMSKFNFIQILRKWLHMNRNKYFYKYYSQPQSVTTQKKLSSVAFKAK